MNQPSFVQIPTIVGKITSVHPDIDRRACAVASIPNPALNSLQVPDISRRLTKLRFMMCLIVCFA